MYNKMRGAKLRDGYPYNMADVFGDQTVFNCLSNDDTLVVDIVTLSDVSVIKLIKIETA
jgi:hypothetical protein